ncbi:TraR/DksA C4-type zinc finger protein [Acinetobacter sp.]|uniref:TraR/DksA C4-type zinc finger protein n=1 Tax=Acinetobacter sp. TaxID=472 RepID=UPI002FCA2A12
MSKKLDIAQQNQLDQVQVTLRDFNIPSLSECEECGNEIPIERQRYGAITLCIECKNKQEQHAKRYF